MLFVDCRIDVQKLQSIFAETKINKNMESNLKIKLVLITVLLITVLLTAQFSKASNVIISVRTSIDTSYVPVDSIVIRNESNQSVLNLANLPQDIHAYYVNLSEANLVTAIVSPKQSCDINIKVSENGFYLYDSNFNEVEDLQVVIHNLEGKTIARHTVSPPAANGKFFRLSQKGVYVVSVLQSEKITKFKILFKQEKTPSNTIINGTSSIVTRSAFSSFSYNNGDRISVYVNKGGQKSLVWYGRPIDGTTVSLAIHRNKSTFDMKQTLSEGAQINTISFSGVAFYSGCYYASTFYPPGKIADYFGFQYLRDNDFTESGHNTDFLTKAAYHLMNILTPNQLQILIDLAVEQDTLFKQYALGRMVLIKAFHRYLDNDLPDGTSSIDIDSVKSVSRKLYLIDGEISYQRALRFAEIIKSLSEEQRDSLSRLGAVGMQMWTMPDKPTVSIPRGMNTWVMSNASELFSWYLRGVEADIYFCPERQGTYFGGFFMKDAPAVGNPGYAIDMQATANKGAYMLDKILDSNQSAEIKKIYAMNAAALEGIVKCRELISNELRKAISGESVNKDSIMSWSAKYGEYDGTYIHDMVNQFVIVGRTLTDEQKQSLVVLRDLANYPCKDGTVFMYSSEIKEPQIGSTDFLFK
jgi:hypothetical protein